MSKTVSCERKKNDADSVIIIIMDTEHLGRTGHKCCGPKLTPAMRERERERERERQTDRQTDRQTEDEEEEEEEEEEEST